MFISDEELVGALKELIEKFRSAESEVSKSGFRFALGDARFAAQEIITKLDYIQRFDTAELTDLRIRARACLLGGERMLSGFALIEGREQVPVAAPPPTDQDRLAGEGDPVVEMELDDLELGRDRLIDLLGEGRYEDALVLIDELVEASFDPLEHVELLRQKADLLAHEIGDQELAIAAYRQVLDIDPFDEGALMSLEEQLWMAERWEELCEILQLRVDITDGDQERVELWIRIAEIQDVQLGLLDESIGSYLFVLDLQPENMYALERLEQHYLMLERWHDLIEIYQRKVEFLTEPSDRIGTLLRLAEIHEEFFDDLIAARICYEEILDIQKDHEYAVSAIERIDNLLE